MPGKKKSKLNPTSHKLSKKKKKLLEEKRLWMHAWQYIGVQS